MREFWHQKNTMRKAQDRKLFLIVSAGLLVSNIILSAKLMFQSERVVLVPPTFSKNIWVQGNEGSSDYITEMSLYMAHLILDVSSYHMAFQHTTLLKFASPGGISALQVKLKEDEKYYSDNAISTTFHPTKVDVDLDKEEVQITGILSQLESCKIVSEKEQTYILKYTMKGGRFMLVSFVQEKGDVA